MGNSTQEALSKNPGGRGGLLTQARRDLRARRQRLGRGFGAGCHGFPGCQGAADQRAVGPGQVVEVKVVAARRRHRSAVVVAPGAVAAVVESAEEVEALRVHVKVEDHHDDEVQQAEQQHAFADAFQGTAQHQPGHGRR